MAGGLFGFALATVARYELIGMIARLGKSNEAWDKVLRIIE